MSAGPFAGSGLDAMTSAQNISESNAAGAPGRGETTVFGLPIGRLGLIARMMMTGACAFIAFFIAFVLGIVGVSIYDAVKGISITNLNDAYLYIAAPVGIAAFGACAIYLIGGWARAKFSGAE